MYFKGKFSYNLIMIYSKVYFMIYTFDWNYNFILNIKHIFGQQNLFRLCYRIKNIYIFQHAA